MHVYCSEYVAPPESGNLGTCASKMLKFGESCAVGCEDGYSLDPGFVQPSCSSMGVLTQKATKCIKDTVQQTHCNTTITAPAHGGYGDCPGKLTKGSTCTMVCDAGFKMAATATQPTCNSNLVLKSDFRCEVANDYCKEKPTAPTNGGLGTCLGFLRKGTACALACNENRGYFVSSTATQPTCTEQAGTNVLTQSAAGDICEFQFCATEVAAPDNGNYGDCEAQLRFNKHCQLACSAGFHVAPGSTQPRCSMTGALTSAVTCERDSVAPTGVPTTLAPTARATTGPTRAPTPSPTVGSTPAPTAALTQGYCNEVLPYPTNGGYGNCKSRLQHGTSCKMVCDDGFTMSSTSTQPVCSMDGHLTHHIVCKAGATVAPTIAPLRSSTNNHTTTTIIKEVDKEDTPWLLILLILLLLLLLLCCGLYYLCVFRKRDNKVVKEIIAGGDMFDESHASRMDGPVLDGIDGVDTNSAWGAMTIEGTDDDSMNVITLDSDDEEGTVENPLSSDPPFVDSGAALGGPGGGPGEKSDKMEFMTLDSSDEDEDDGPGSTTPAVQTLSSTDEEDDDDTDDDETTNVEVVALTDSDDEDEDEPAFRPAGLGQGMGRRDKGERFAGDLV